MTASVPAAILFWIFLLGWALFAAYLVVVLQIQNGIAAWLGRFLFGGGEDASHPAPAAEPSHAASAAHHAGHHAAHGGHAGGHHDDPGHPPKLFQRSFPPSHGILPDHEPNFDDIDEFLVSQLKRSEKGA